jgi:DNA-binding NarL/FixJ family response regulator
MRVRRLAATDGIAGRVVMVSPHTDPRDQRAALEAGATAYVSKPLRRELLIDAIEAVARRGVKSRCCAAVRKRPARAAGRSRGPS